MRWRRSTKRIPDDDYLGGVTSELEGFGSSGGEGFSQLWDAAADSGGSEAPDSVFFEEVDGPTLRSRDLDRRSRRGVWGLAAIAILGAVIASSVRHSSSVAAPLADPADVTASLQLNSIADEREYVSGPSDLALTSASSLDTEFRLSSSDSALTMDGREPFPQGVSMASEAQLKFGLVLWAGRLHVAVIGVNVQAEQACVITTLVTDNLEVLDLASFGTCTADFAPTGDRIACAGDDLIMLEVWPFDPDSPVAKPKATQVRTRLEHRLAATQPDSPAIVDSARGALSLAGGLLDSSDLLTGHPGDEVRIQAGGRVGTCELLDRADVPVQLL